MSKTITAYAAHKLVNNALRELGVLNAKGETKTIPPQMIYTYVRKGYIQSEKGLVLVDPFTKWLEKYLSTQTMPVADPEQHEFDAAEAH